MIRTRLNVVVGRSHQAANARFFSPQPIVKATWSDHVSVIKSLVLTGGVLGAFSALVWFIASGL